MVEKDAVIERQHYKGLAWVASMALFMQSLDATILNTALPTIAQIYKLLSLKCKWRLSPILLPLLYLFL